VTKAAKKTMTAKQIEQLYDLCCLAHKHGSVPTELVDMSKRPVEELKGMLDTHATPGTLFRMVLAPMVDVDTLPTVTGDTEDDRAQLLVEMRGKRKGGKNAK
jgi:hypothetical protein